MILESLCDDRMDKRSRQKAISLATQPDRWTWLPGVDDNNEWVLISDGKQIGPWLSTVNISIDNNPIILNRNMELVELNHCDVLSIIKDTEIAYIFDSDTGYLVEIHKDGIARCGVCTDGK